MAKTNKVEVPEAAVPANAEKLKAFDDVLKHLNNDKNLQTDTGNIIAKLSDRAINVETISTGSVVLDSITGGGFPKGRLIEIYGKESSGKTSIALTAVGNVQREGGTAVFIDVEHALDPRYAKKLGVDVDNLAVSQPDHAEQALQLVSSLAASGVVDIIVLDSIAALVPKAELEGTMEQQTIGALARLMSKGLRKIISIANRTNTTIIFVNQTRDAIGQFSPMGTPTTTPGGKAMKFYASQRIEINRMQKVMDGKEAIGNEVRLTVRKNKIAPPFGQGVTVLTFGHGINRAAEIIETGPDYKVVGRPNNRKYIEAATGEVIGNSKAEAVERLNNDPELLARLEARLKEVINASIFDGELPSEDPEKAATQEKPEDATESFDVEDGSHLGEKKDEEGSTEG